MLLWSAAPLKYDSGGLPLSSIRISTIPKLKVVCLAQWSAAFGKQPTLWGLPLTSIQLALIKKDESRNIYLFSPSVTLRGCRELLGSSTWTAVNKCGAGVAMRMKHWMMRGNSWRKKSVVKSFELCWCFVVVCGRRKNGSEEGTALFMQTSSIIHLNELEKWWRGTSYHLNSSGFKKRGKRRGNRSRFQVYPQL